MGRTPGFNNMPVKIAFERCLLKDLLRGYAMLCIEPDRLRESNRQGIHL